MATRQIDANELGRYLFSRFHFQRVELEDVIADMADFADKNTIEAEPVRHGYVVWKTRFVGGYKHGVTITDHMGERHTGTLDTTGYEEVPYCSECGKELGLSSLAYCPNCGAKMDAKGARQ